MVTSEKSGAVLPLALSNLSSRPELLYGYYQQKHYNWTDELLIKAEHTCYYRDEGKKSQRN